MTTLTLGCAVCGEHTPIWNIMYRDSLEGQRYSELFSKLRGRDICTSCFEKERKNYTPRTVYMCKHCDTIHHTTSPINAVCQDCFSRYYKKCSFCGGFHTGDTSVRRTRAEVGDSICDKCVRRAGDSLSSCGYCGMLYEDKDNHPTPHGGGLCLYCRENYTFCQMGKHYTHKHGAQARQVKLGKAQSGDTPTVMGCDQCAARLFTCPSCENIYPRGEALPTSSGQHLCYDCHSEETYSSQKRQHNYRPPYFITHGSDKNDLYFGVENEVVVEEYGDSFSESRVRCEMGRVLREFGSHTLYLKHDGSIGGDAPHGINGFEVVLHPRSFRSFASTTWDALFCGRQVGRHITCGMHVHMTKQAFTTYHLYKFLNFIYRNPDFIQKVGERAFTLYCKPNSKVRSKIDAKEKKSQKGPGDMFRRQAVNLCNNDTIELRFFANAETVQTFLKNIEFCHALFFFTRDSSKKDSLDVKKFVDFVNRSHPVKPYVNLKNFLATIHPLKNNNEGAN